MSTEDSRTVEHRSHLQHTVEAAFLSDNETPVCNADDDDCKDDCNDDDDVCCSFEVNP